MGEIQFWSFLIILGGASLYYLIDSYETEEELEPVISKEMKEFFGIYEESN